MQKESRSQFEGRAEMETTPKIRLLLEDRKKVICWAGS